MANIKKIKIGNTEYDIKDDVSGYITGISSTDVTTALGYTPYDSSNPNGYTTNVGTVTSVNNVSPVNGNVSLTIPTVNVDDVQINGTSILSSKVANIVTNTAYNASSNKIATMSDVPTVDQTYDGTSSNPQSGVAVASAISNLADTDLSNLSATGEKHFLNKTQITNCIIEAPNGVCTANGRTLTFKEGLKVLIPDGRNTDGTLKNKELTLTEDITTDLSSFDNNVTRMVSLTYSNDTFGIISVYSYNVLYLISANKLPSTVSDTNYYLAYCEKENYWYQTNGSTTANWSQVARVPIVGVRTATNSLSFDKPKQPVHLCDISMTDGQWIEKSQVIASDVNFATGGTETKTYSLISYLPNDGYTYEVLFSVSGQTAATNGASFAFMLNSDIVSNVFMCRNIARSAAYTFAYGNAIIPLNARQIKVTQANTTSATPTMTSLRMCGYRRVGTNT